MFLFADDFYCKKANGHENTGFIIVVKIKALRTQFRHVHLVHFWELVCFDL